MKLDVISFEQPAGNFLLAIIPANDLIRISRADPRKFDTIKYKVNKLKLTLILNELAHIRQYYQIRDYQLFNINPILS